MDQQIIGDCKFHVEGNDLDSLQNYLFALLTEPQETPPDWPYIFHRVYLHACLKGNSEIAGWLEHTVYPMLDGIQKIALRQIFLMVDIYYPRLKVGSMGLGEFVKMPQAQTLHNFFSRFAFIFVIFSVVSSGYITEVLSCQMRNYLNTSTYFRHLIGILMIFVFIMLEGGWSFDRDEDEKAENDWSSGDVLGSVGMALIIYGIFIISSKSQLIPNLIFFILLFILYLLNTQREYWYKRKKISEDTNKNILISEYVISSLAGLVMIYGFIDYVYYQKSQYKSKFSWEKFILGAHICAGSKNAN